MMKSEQTCRLLLRREKVKKEGTTCVVPSFLEQDTGIEPASSAWEADILPMY